MPARQSHGALLAVSGPRFLIPPSVPERANDASLSVSAAVLLPFSLPLSAIRLSFTVSCDMSTSQYHARHLFPTHTSSAPRFSARVRAVYNLVPRLLSSPSCHFITPVADNFSRAFAFNRSRRNLSSSTRSVSPTLLLANFQFYRRNILLDLYRN